MHVYAVEKSVHDACKVKYYLVTFSELKKRKKKEVMKNTVLNNLKNLYIPIIYPMILAIFSVIDFLK